MTVQETVAAQKAYFAEGATRQIDFRKDKLRRLRDFLDKNETAICEALNQDLCKSPTEAYLTEIAMVRQELNFQLKHLAKFSRPKKVKTPLFLWPAKSRVLSEPYGLVLIMSPWNYPFQLTVLPLVEALAAGNCVMLKPSAFAPATGALIARMVAECFDPRLVSITEGGRDANTALLAQPFDYIFFTGSKGVGQVVMEACAKHLTPMTLELGGKSPCIVDATANLDLAAKRIVYGKGLNAGQTCVAPDYLLVDAKVKEPLLQKICQEAANMFSETPCQNPAWPCIINEKHFDRLLSLIAGQSVILGGEYQSANRKIAFTLLDNVSFDDPCMQEEIFGPILPIISYETVNEALSKIAALPRPLALYLFTQDKALQKRVSESVAFGGGCINDTVMHLANHSLPFGGVGPSGMGAYHGKTGFETFSRQKSLLVQSGKADIALRYPPYAPNTLKKLKKYF